MARKKVVIKKKTRGDQTGIYISVIAIVIILISGWMIYSTIKANDNDQKVKLPEAIKKKETAVKALAEEETKLLELSRLVGWRAEASRDSTIKGGWTESKPMTNTLNSWVAILKDNYNITKYVPWEPEGAPNSTEKYLTVTKLIGELEKIAENDKTARAAAEKDRDAQRRENLRLTADVPNLLKNKNDEIATMRSNIQIEGTRIKGMVDAGDAEIRDKTQELETKIRDALTFVHNLEEVITISTTVKADYEKRLETLKKKLRLTEEGREVDGEIIVADPLNGYVYLDLCRKDAVMEGLEFEVFVIKEGGLKLRKGRVKILKVYDTSSEATIIESSSDPQLQISKGDLVNSDLYSRSRLKTFFFLGTLIGQYNEEALTKKIEEFGGKVLTEVIPDINYLIVGDGFNTDQRYQKIVELGVTVIREKELYALLGLEW